MMFLWDSAYFLAPEIFLSCCTLLFLVFSLWNKNHLQTQSTKEQRLIHLSILALLGTIVLMWVAPEKGTFFQGALETDVFIRSFKTGLLLTAICVLSISTISWISTPHFLFESPLLLLFSTLGGLLSIAAGDFLMLFLALELQALPLYILVAFNKSGSGTGAGTCISTSEASLKYFTLGALATGFFLFGVSLIYGSLGTIQFQSAQKFLHILADNGGGISAFPTHLLIGFIFVIGALFFKLALAPFHMWAPDVYEGAKTSTVLFIASCVKISAIFVLFKLISSCFQAIQPWVGDLLSITAGLSMIIGALGGLFQEKFQRLLAYSGISHMGFLMSTLVVDKTAGLEALLTYLLIYIPMVLLAFMLLLILKKRSESPTLFLFELRGLGKSSPLFAFFVAILMFSLAGIPPLGGFLGKFSVLIALINEGHLSLGLVCVLTSVISCYYYLRVIKFMYFEKNGDEHASTVKTWDLSFQNRILLLTLMAITLGFTAFRPLISFPWQHLN